MGHQPTRVPPLLLPPPPSRAASFSASLVTSGYLSIENILRGGLLLLKVLTLTSPCGARAVNPVLVYPLMVAAILEYTARVNVSIVLGTSIGHIMILIVSFRKQTLCVFEPG